MSDSEYVKIKLNSSKENKARGFYILMTNGNISSDSKDVFLVKREYLKKLDDAKVKYKEIPSDN